jgi:pyruvate/2-oxoglutarate/acetoin dehydrogenase E1 component
MIRHSNLVLMGQDIAEYGGAFKITEGLVQEFGRDAFEIRRSVKAQLWEPHWD